MQFSTKLFLIFFLFLFNLFYHNIEFIVNTIKYISDKGEVHFETKIPFPLNRLSVYPYWM